MLLEIFNDHNKKCCDLLDKDYVLGTVLCYEMTVRYLSEYMKQQYRINDIPLKDLTDEFILGFEHYIKTNKPCSQNTTVKYLKKIVHLALANHWIATDPFLEIKLRQTQANRAFLL